MMWMSERRDDGSSGRGDQATRELPPSRQKSDGGSLPTSRHNSRPPTRSGSRPSTDDSLRHGIGGPVFRLFGWCVCNSSNTLPALEKLASNVPSAWPSSFNVASHWFPLVGVHVAGGFCNIFRHDEVIKPQQDDLCLLLAKEIIPVWHEGVVTPFLPQVFGV